MYVTDIVPQLIVARQFGGTAVVRHAVAVGERTVYITDKDGLSAIMSGRPTVRTVGFPSRDIFQFQAGISDGDAPDWSGLVNWRPQTVVA
jgi:hypothetical protein